MVASSSAILAYLSPIRPNFYSRRFPNRADVGVYLYSVNFGLRSSWLIRFISVSIALSVWWCTQIRPGACTHCKKLKVAYHFEIHRYLLIRSSTPLQMRCEFENPTDIVCKRCRNTRHQCIVEGRKPRTQPKYVQVLFHFTSFRYSFFYSVVLFTPSFSMHATNPELDTGLMRSPHVLGPFLA